MTPGKSKDKRDDKPASAKEGDRRLDQARKRTRGRRSVLSNAEKK